MQIDLSGNYFALFSFPVAFDLDEQLLAERYRDLQSKVHPDRFTNDTDQARRYAIQMASRVNEAYQTLKSPLKRGFYLLELRGLEAAPDHQTTNDAEFLMQQMVLRERLEEIPEAADPLSEIDQLYIDVRAEIAQLTRQFKADYQAGDNATAQQSLVKLQFYERLKKQLSDVEAQLEGLHY